MLQIIYKVFIVFTSIIYANCSLHKSDIKNTEKPLIVWWYDTIFPHVENGDKIHDISCGKFECSSTHNREMVKRDVFQTIMFYGSDFQPTDLPLSRKNNHMVSFSSMSHRWAARDKWALLHEESPQNNFILCHEDVLKLFNFSSTFKQYSDYPLTTQYIPNIEYLFQEEMFSILEKNEYRRDGLAPVLYLQSHCDVPSDRDRYVSELMKFIQVDSYGACLNNIEFDNEELVGMQSLNSEELFDLIGQYKFHIAFENAICDDYITEKLYRALHVGSVPIYMGASNVKDWSPERSYISVNHFNSPRALAAFLNTLDADDASYLEYLKYKQNKTNVPQNMKRAMEDRDWSTNDPDVQHFINGFECYVCKEMHRLQDLLNTNEIIETKALNKSHLDCPLPQPSVGTIRTLKKDDSFYEMQEYYKQTRLHSRILSELIKKGETNLSDFWEHVAEHIHTIHSEL